MPQTNYLYTSPNVIAADIARKYKGKDIDKMAVNEWCAHVETRHIKDVDSMMDFEGIGVEIEGGMLSLPCNVFRLLDVYDDSYRHVVFNTNGAYLYDMTNEYGTEYENGETIYLNYKGIPVDADGMILIARGHQIACETYCKMSMFEEDFANGKFNQNLYLLWEQRFPGQAQAAKNNFRKVTRKDLDRTNIIQANMIQKIGELPIKQRMFKNV